MLDVWATRFSQPIRPTSTKLTIFTQVNFSLLHFTQDIQVPMDVFDTKTLKLTIMWCHVTTNGTKRVKLSTLLVVVVKRG